MPHLSEVIEILAPDCPPDHVLQRALKLPMDQAHSNSTGAHILQRVRRLGSQVTKQHHEPHKEKPTCPMKTSSPLRRRSCGSTP